jgi:ATP-dependent protease ClpP protease subunit
MGRGILAETRERSARVQMNSMVVDDAPNPDRAIWVDESLREPLLTRLRPRIVDLVSSSRSPVTVYIRDCGGGFSNVAQTILTLLKWPDPSDKSRCHVTTVALGQVSSAATDLLCGGDTAIAHQDSKLLFHGSAHTAVPGRLTAELAETLAVSTKFTDEGRAASFARTSTRRAMRIVSALRSDFADYRLQVGNPNLSDLECFQGALRSRLSPAGQRVIRRARAMQTRSEALLHCYRKERDASSPRGKVDLEKLMLNASVAFECRHRNRLLSAGGLSRINGNFFFLREFVGDEQGARIGDFCDVPAEQTRETFCDYSLPFWSFLIAVYRALGQGENTLTATDAMWLGLVDTVAAGAAGGVEPLK